MKVKHLISLLNELNPEADVLMATQPNYPLQATVAGVWAHTGDEPCGYESHGEECRCEASEADATTVYIVEGSSGSLPSPYAPRAAFSDAKAF